MRQWDGIRDDMTTGGDDGLHSAIGVSFAVEGELGRRTGLTALAAFGGAALGHFRSPVNGSWLLIVRSNGAIEAVSL